MVQANMQMPARRSLGEGGCKFTNVLIPARRSPGEGAAYILIFIMR
jgi:hypothetical protein